jgi:hypothetical protein
MQADTVERSRQDFAISKGEVEGQNVHRVLARNLLLEAELRAILRTFNEREIQVAVLKGIPLTRRLHGHLAWRHMLDIDLLVHRHDVPRAAQTLEELAYLLGPFHSIDGDLRSDFQSVLFRDSACGFRLWVELHWSAFPPQMFDVPEELPWSRTQKFEVAGEEALVFDPAMTLLHLASHFAQHRLSEPRILRDIANAWELWSNLVSSSDLEQLATTTGVVHALDFSLRAAQDLGWTARPPCPLVSRQANLLRRLLPSQRLLEESHSYYERTLLTALLLRPRRAAGWLLHQAAPPAERLSAIYQEPLGPLLYLRYLTRPARVLLRLSRGQHRHQTRA